MFVFKAQTCRCYGYKLMSSILLILKQKKKNLKQKKNKNLHDFNFFFEQKPLNHKLFFELMIFVL